MIELPLEFKGKGQLNQFMFKQLSKSDKAYIYEKKGIDDNSCTYEVFKRKEQKETDANFSGTMVHLDAKVMYPGNEAFGVWAWDISDFDNAFKRWESLTVNIVDTDTDEQREKKAKDYIDKHWEEHPFVKEEVSQKDTTFATKPLEQMIEEDKKLEAEATGGFMQMSEEYMQKRVDGMYNHVIDGSRQMFSVLSPEEQEQVNNSNLSDDEKEILHTHAKLPKDATMLETLEYAFKSIVPIEVKEDTIVAIVSDKTADEFLKQTELKETNIIRAEFPEKFLTHKILKDSENKDVRILSVTDEYFENKSMDQNLEKVHLGMDVQPEPEDPKTLIGIDPIIDEIKDDTLLTDSDYVIVPRKIYVNVMGHMQRSEERIIDGKTFYVAPKSDVQ